MTSSWCLGFFGIDVHSDELYEYVLQCLTVILEFVVRFEARDGDGAMREVQVSKVKELSEMVERLDRNTFYSVGELEFRGKNKGVELLRLIERHWRREVVRSEGGRQDVVAGAFVR